MTQTEKSYDYSAAMSRYQADRATYEAEATRLRNANKPALFAVLKAASITQVVVSFDGYGDSGQIESVDATTNNKPVALPDGNISLTYARHGQVEETRIETIREAIESMAYDCLSETHCGWENNDGAYGEFIFDVGEGSITLDYNERYTDSEHYAHEF